MRRPCSSFVTLNQMRASALTITADSFFRSHVLSHADRIAKAVGLDVAAAGWSPTVDNYFGRVINARIVQAVREAKGETAAAIRLLVGPGKASSAA
jgi:hypothetical protein